MTCHRIRVAHSGTYDPISFIGRGQSSYGRLGGVRVMRTKILPFQTDDCHRNTTGHIGQVPISFT